MRDDELAHELSVRCGRHPFYDDHTPIAYRVHAIAHNKTSTFLLQSVWHPPRRAVCYSSVYSVELSTGHALGFVWQWHKIAENKDPWPYRNSLPAYFDPTNHIRQIGWRASLLDGTKLYAPGERTAQFQRGAVAAIITAVLKRGAYR